MIVEPNHVVFKNKNIVILKGLKQLTFKGYSAWDVCEDKIIMFSPRVCDCFIFSRVKCELCPFKINGCLLIKKMLPQINIVNNNENALNR